MKVTVEGKVVSVKDRVQKGVTDVYLTQPDEFGLICVRVYNSADPDLVANIPTKGQNVEYTGQLYAWARDDGKVGTMVGVR